MSSPRYIYQNLANFPEYQNFQYNFDFATVISGISFVFLIPSIFCLTKMLIFFLKNPKITVSSNGIHPFVFKSFLIMQFWNTFNTLFDFLTLRIPSTTIFTSTCVQFGPGSLYRFVVAGVFFTFNNAQFFTVLFCSMRVLILYTLLNQDKLCRRLFFIWSILTYFLSFADSVGNIFGSVLCLQLDAPFQDGAMYTSTTFAFKNTFMNSLHFGFSTGIIIVIVITTALVVIKLRSAEMRKATSRSLHRTKAETVLTVTTILIIIPLFFAQGLTIASLTKSPYYSYILCIRPLILDLRVNLVSIYFFMTHPLFKRKVKTSTVVTTIMRSYGSATF